MLKLKLPSLLCDEIICLSYLRLVQILNDAQNGKVSILVTYKIFYIKKPGKVKVVSKNILISANKNMFFNKGKSRSVYRISKVIKVKDKMYPGKN